MTFNPDITKQTQELIFSYNSIKANHPLILFKDIPAAHKDCQKHLAMHLDTKFQSTY